MVALDCTGIAEATCKEYKVQSYPTIRYFADDDYEEYEGGRTEKDFIKFLSEVTEDAEMLDDSKDEEKGKPKEDKAPADGKAGQSEKDNANADEEHEVDMKKDEL